MTPRNILAEFAKGMINLEVSENKIAEVAGWSRRTFLSRWKNPETITLGEAEKITAYLNLKMNVS